MRWRFDFDDGRIEVGAWLNPVIPHLGVPKMGLVRACIEDIHGKAVAECRGDDFINVQWLAIAALTPDKLDSGEPLPQAIVGMKLVAKNKSTYCLVNGEVKEQNHDAQ